MSLEAAERETVFRIADDERQWIVSSFRRSDITKLRKNPDFVITEEGTFEGTAFVHGLLPMGAITIRATTGRSKGKSEATKPKRSMPANAARCSGTKADGSPCGSLASKETGRCSRHPLS